MAQQMTSLEYVESAGNECPFCRSRNIIGHNIDSDCDYAWRKVECNNCGKLWTENFKLIGYEQD